jgi:hypothetical protein
MLIFFKINFILLIFLIFQGCSSSPNSINTIKPKPTVIYINKGHNLKNIIYANTNLTNNCPNAIIISKKEIKDTKVIFRGCMAKNDFLGEIKLYLNKNIDPIEYDLEVKDLISCDKNLKDSVEFGLINTKQFEDTGLAKKSGANIKLSICQERLSKTRVAINHIIDLEYY